MERPKQINLRLSLDEYAALEKARGLVPREAFLRDLFSKTIGDWPGATSLRDFAEAARGEPFQPANRADAFRQSTQGRRRK